jgi:hypothetical protein
MPERIAKTNKQLLPKKDVWQQLFEKSGGKLTKESTLHDLKNFTKLGAELRQRLEERLSVGLDREFALAEFKRVIPAYFTDFEGEHTQQAYYYVKAGQNLSLFKFFELYVGYELEYEFIELAAEGVDYAFFEPELIQHEINDEWDTTEVDDIKFVKTIHLTALIHELGIDRHLLERYKDDNTHNFSRVANILAYITGHNAKTIRRALDDLHKGGGRGKNNPLKSNKASIYVSNVMQQLKLKSEK